MTLAEQFDRHVRNAGRRVTAALAWWIEGLWMGLPETLRERLFVRRRTLAVRFADDTMIVEPLRIEPTSRTPEPLATVPLAAIDRNWQAVTAEVVPIVASADVTLVLPNAARLTHRLSLPAAAEAELERVLYYELDRRTPFDIDQCVFDYVVRDREPGCSRLSVEFVLTERQALNEHIRVARAAGVEPRTASAANGDGEVLRLDLLGGGPRISLPRLKAAPSPVVASLAALAIVAALYVPLIRYEASLAEFERTTEIARQRAVELRAALDAERALTAGIDYLNERRRGYARPIDALGALTDALADDTWITRFAVTNEGLRLQGESAAPSTVLEIVESSALFERAEFESPVSRSRTSGKQEFTISAALAEDG